MNRSLLTPTTIVSAFSLSGCLDGDVDLETGSGDIGARITGVLESVQAETGSGDVELRIPSGAYQIDIDTGSGDVPKGGLVDDPAAPHVIDVRTGSGDVALRGA